MYGTGENVSNVIQFNYANAIVDMLFAMNDLASDYVNDHGEDIDYAELIESRFIEFVNDEGSDIGIITDKEEYMRFNDRVNEVCEMILNDIVDDDDINDIVSAINTIVHIVID